MAPSAQVGRHASQKAISDRSERGAQSILEALDQLRVRLVSFQPGDGARGERRQVRVAVEQLCVPGERGAQRRRVVSQLVTQSRQQHVREAGPDQGLVVPGALHSQAP